jgi:murein DD-endopeptidase MepM/ murein hydrolase activator NlpD
MHRNNYFRVLALLLLLVALATAALPVYANLLDEKRQEQAELEERLARERSNLTQQKNRKAELEEELAQLDRRLEQLRAELARLVREIGSTAQEIAVTETELAAAEEQFAYQDGLFKRRLRAVYEQGYVTYLEVLLNASSFSDFLTRLNSLRLIAANDLRLIDEIRAERERIQALKDSLEQKKNRLEGMRRDTLAYEAEVERTVSTRERKMAELQDEIARQEKQIRDLEKQAAELDKTIQELLRKDGVFAGLRAPVFWPVASPWHFTSGFGWRNNPTRPGYAEWHAGIDLATYGRANKVFAADHGVVIFSGIWRWDAAHGSVHVNLAPAYDAWRTDLIWYGSYIMIDHGKNQVTVYAHLSSRAVAKGDTVSRGQHIANVGTTGNSTGYHLHFEVRDYNLPPYYPYGSPDYRQNPREYLPPF